MFVQYVSGWQENKQKRLRPGKNMPCRYIVHISIIDTIFVGLPVPDDSRCMLGVMVRLYPISEDDRCCV